MKELFETLANQRDWYFEYGRSDFHNLYDGDDKRRFKMFLDPIVESDLTSGFGNLENKSFEGRFMLLINSDLDGVYDTQEGTNEENGKYEMHIKPCKKAVSELRGEFGCIYDIDQWRIMEVINVFDVNADGVLVTFKFTQHF